jgi:hypothetical protein
VLVVEVVESWAWRSLLLQLVLKEGMLPMLDPPVVLELGVEEGRGVVHFQACEREEPLPPALLLVAHAAQLLVLVRNAPTFPSLSLPLRMEKLQLSRRKQ